MQTLPMLMADLVVDPYFIEFVTKEIALLKTKRAMRPPAPDGMRYKRDWYDTMEELHLLNPDIFIRQFPLIMAKKSATRPEHRDVIKSVCSSAYWKTVKKYDEINEGASIEAESDGVNEGVNY